MYPCVRLVSANLYIYDLQTSISYHDLYPANPRYWRGTLNLLVPQILPIKPSIVIRVIYVIYALSMNKVLCIWKYISSLGVIELTELKLTTNGAECLNSCTIGDMSCIQLYLSYIVYKKIAPNINISVQHKKVYYCVIYYFSTNNAIINTFLVILEAFNTFINPRCVNENMF